MTKSYYLEKGELKCFDTEDNSWDALCDNTPNLMDHNVRILTKEEASKYLLEGHKEFFKNNKKEYWRLHKRLQRRRNRK